MLSALCGIICPTLLACVIVWYVYQTIVVRNVQRQNKEEDINKGLNVSDGSKPNSGNGEMSEGGCSSGKIRSRGLTFVAGGPELKTIGYQRRCAIYLRNAEMDCTNEDGTVTRVNVRDVTNGRVLRVKGDVEWVFGNRVYALIGGQLSSAPATRSQLDIHLAVRNTDSCLLHPVMVRGPVVETASAECQTDIKDVTQESVVPIVRARRPSFFVICIVALCISLLIESARADGVDDMKEWVRQNNPIKIPKEIVDQFRMYLMQFTAFTLWLFIWTPIPMIIGGIITVYRSPTWPMSVFNGVLHLVTAMCSRFTIIPAVVSTSMGVFWGLCCNAVWILCVEPSNLFIVGAVLLTVWVWKVGLELQIRPVADPVSGVLMTAAQVVKVNAESCVLCALTGCLSVALHAGDLLPASAFAVSAFIVYCYCIPSEELVVTQKHNGKVIAVRVVPQVKSRNGLWFKLRAKTAATRTSEAMWDNCFRVHSGSLESIGFQYRGMMWVLDHGIEPGRPVEFRGTTKFSPNKRKSEKIVLEHDGTTGFGVDGCNIVRQPKLAEKTSDGWKTMVHFDGAGKRCATCFYGVWRNNTLTGLTEAQPGDSGAPVYNDEGQLEAIYMGGGTGVGVFSPAQPLKLKPVVEEEIKVEENEEPLEENVVAIQQHATMKGKETELSANEDLKLQLAVMAEQVRNLGERLGDISFELCKKKGKVKKRAQQEKVRREKKKTHYRAYPKQNMPMFREGEYEELQQRGIPLETIKAAARSRWIDYCNTNKLYEDREADEEESDSGDSEASATYERHAKVKSFDYSEYDIPNLRPTELKLKRKDGACTYVDYDDGRVVEHSGMMVDDDCNLKTLSMYQARNAELASIVDDMVAQNESNVCDIEAQERLIDSLKEQLRTAHEDNDLLRQEMEQCQTECSSVKISLSERIDEMSEVLKNERVRCRDAEEKLAQMNARKESCSIEVQTLETRMVYEGKVQDEVESTEWQSAKRTRNRRKKEQKVDFVEPTDFNLHAAKRRPAIMPCGQLTTVPSGHYTYSKKNGKCDCGKAESCPAGEPLETPCKKHCNHWWCAKWSKLDCTRENCSNLWCVEKKKGVSDMTPKESGDAGGPAASPQTASS